MSEQPTTAGFPTWAKVVIALTLLTALVFGVQSYMEKDRGGKGDLAKEGKAQKSRRLPRGKGGKGKKPEWRLREPSEDEKKRNVETPMLASATNCKAGAAGKLVVIGQGITSEYKNVDAVLKDPAAVTVSQGRLAGQSALPLLHFFPGIAATESVSLIRCNGEAKTFTVADLSANPQRYLLTEAGRGNLLLVDSTASKGQGPMMRYVTVLQQGAVDLTTIPTPPPPDPAAVQPGSKVGKAGRGKAGKGKMKAGGGAEGAGATEGAGGAEASGGATPAAPE